MRVPAYKGSPTETAFFYFKTSIDLPLFVNEAVVTDELAALFPGYVPQPIALDAQKDGMVLADFGPLVGHDAPLEDKLEILRQFAGIQKESAVMVEQLVAVGCCDRRLAWMVGEIEPFLTNPEIEMAITAEEAAQLRSLVAPLQVLCRKLYDYAVPDALIHGDLHGSNVARNDSHPGQLLFFDWTDCAVSHPFFDMLLIYTTKEAVDMEKMRDLYLSQWLDYEPLDRLLELWQMAKALAAVYHGISYLYIRDGLEEWGRSEMYWAMPYWLRKILEYSESIYEN
jgi:hypothetical protein